MNERTRDALLCTALIGCMMGVSAASIPLNAQASWFENFSKYFMWGNAAPASPAPTPTPAQTRFCASDTRACCNAHGAVVSYVNRDAANGCAFRDCPFGTNSCDVPTPTTSTPPTASASSSAPMVPTPSSESTSSSSSIGASTPTTTPSSSASTAPFCGDKEVNGASEQCDNGGVCLSDMTTSCTHHVDCALMFGPTPGDLCIHKDSASCTGCKLGASSSSNSSTAPFCGDGSVNGSNERCDNGGVCQSDGVTSCTHDVDCALMFDPTPGDRCIHKDSPSCAGCHPREVKCCTCYWQNIDYCGTTFVTEEECTGSYNFANECEWHQGLCVSRFRVGCNKDFDDNGCDVRRVFQDHTLNVPYPEQLECTETLDFRKGHSGPSLCASFFEIAKTCVECESAACQQHVITGCSTMSNREQARSHAESLRQTLVGKGIKAVIVEGNQLLAHPICQTRIKFTVTEAGVEETYGPCDFGAMCFGRDAGKTFLCKDGDVTKEGMCCENLTAAVPSHIRTSGVGDPPACPSETTGECGALGGAMFCSNAAVNAWGNANVRCAEAKQRCMDQHPGATFSKSCDGHFVSNTYVPPHCTWEIECDWTCDW